MKNKIGVLCFWLVLWQILSMAVGHSVLLPQPTEVFFELVSLITTISFWSTIIYSTFKIMLGLVLGIILGCICAYISFKVDIIKQIIHPAIVTLRSVPVASFIILILVWVSANNLSIVISMIMGFPIIYINIYTAFTQLDTGLNEMATVFNLENKTKIRYIYIPQIVPYFKSAILLAVGFCFKAGITAEILGLQENTIGDKLFTAKMYLEIPNLFAWTIVIICLNFLLEKITVLIIERIEG